MTRVFEGQRTVLHPVLRPLERLCYRLCGVRKTWSSAGRNTRAACWRSVWSSFLFVYLIQRLQGWLPLNPQGFSTAHAPTAQRR